MSTRLPRLFCLVSTRDDLDLLPALAGAGLAGFQLRDKRVGDREFAGFVRLVRDRLAPYDAMLVVDDRLDVALAAGADGVHLGAEDLSVADARRVAESVAPRLIVGATCRDRAMVERAAAEGASYAGFGPIRATASKDGLPPPLGTAAIGAAAGVLPLIAIGGIDAPVAAEARAAGAHGVAVIGAVWGHPDPVAAARRLVRTVSR